MPVISQFELYNQPLMDDPNSADLLAPMMSGITEGVDISEKVKRHIVSKFGRVDVHKFQNIVESGETPTIGFPQASLNLMVILENGYSRIGHLRVIDWVNMWMMDNLGYTAYSIRSPDEEPATLVGIIETNTAYIPLISYDVYSDNTYTVVEKSNVEVPKGIPKGTYRITYTYIVVEEDVDDDVVGA